ncbi:MAG: hypothetical protein IJ877_07585 [Candidatus Gastranaerophilales bacterium]|nr:hypothetical protein [Candidatus Gastranaerophilales bacterium]
MRKLLILFYLLIFSTPSWAINWVEVTAKNGHNAFIDMDSIKEYKNYYFYNIKVLNSHTNKDVVITVQSNKKTSLSARINFYDPLLYEQLKGDYEHITDKLTKQMETAEYGSVVYACYTKVKNYMQIKQTKIQI